MKTRTTTAQWMENQRRWQINVQKDGIRRTFTSSKPGRTGQREANAKADAWLEDGISSSGGNLSKLFPLYLEDLQSRTSRGHWRNVEYRWRIWGEPVIGRVRPAQLNEQHLQTVINRAYSKGKLSKKSLMNIRADLTAFTKFLRKSKLTTCFPENIIIPHSAAVGVRRILQPEHLATLFTVDTTLWRGKRKVDEHIHAYRFQLLTGLRPGELLGLRWEDVAGDRISLRRSVNIYNEETTGKNENAIRSFALTPMARAVLDAQREISCEQAAVFPVSTEDQYRRRWRYYCEANGIPYISPYEMRHTFVSMVQSLPEGWVKTLVGHSKNMDTFGVYAHAINGQDAQIAARVEQVFQELMGSGQS